MYIFPFLKSNNDNITIGRIGASFMIAGIYLILIGSQIIIPTKFVIIKNYYVK